MASQRRKIGHYYLEAFGRGQRIQTSPERIIQALSFITTLNPNARFREIGNNRFMFLDSVKNPGAGDYHLLIFMSAKTQFRPELWNQLTGARRDNPKRLSEGEACKTHVILKRSYDGNGRLVPRVHLLLEEFKLGVGITDVAKYLNAHLKEYQRTNKMTPQQRLECSVVLPDGFMEQIRHAERVARLVVTAEREILGSEHLGFAERMEPIDKKVDIIIRPAPGESLIEVVEHIAQRVVGGDEGFQARSIRVEYKDFDGNTGKTKAEIDSSQLTLAKDLGKADWIDASVSPSTGEVETADCFRQMKALF